MKAVVDGVIALHVPAVVVLIHAVAVDPDDRGMLLRSIEVSGDEQPGRHGLAVGPGIVKEFGFDECPTIHGRRHRVGQADRLRIRPGVDDEEVGGIVRIGMLKNDAFSVRRPDGRDVGSPAGRDDVD